MATYNGEKYIAEQIDSLLKQTYQDIKIYILDDSSTDKTWQIVCEYAERYPTKIFVQRQLRNTGNAKHNFFQLMKTIRDDYLMPCDQDDVWLPEKIEKTLRKMKEIEEAHGTDMPILVHTDFCTTDQMLNILDSSARNSAKFNCNRTALHQILTQNVVAGSTAMYNRALADLIYEEPNYCVMHDWWLALLASALGTISYINESTVLHRLHEKNVSGGIAGSTILRKLYILTHRDIMVTRISELYLQAASLLEQYKEILSEDKIALLEEYCSLPKHNKFKKWKIIFKLKCYHQDFYRDMIYLLFV